MADPENTQSLWEISGPERRHQKASERYLDVVFHYADAADWHGSIPIEYRRTGVDLTDALEIEEYLLQAHGFCHPQNWSEWRQEQNLFWQSKPGAAVTKPFFDAMLPFEWVCSCKFPPNPNPQRRIQDIKEFGYTVASFINRSCLECGRKKIAHLLVPLPRGGLSGYEAWSPSLRTRIVNVLNGYDVYEASTTNKSGLLPDHKFPEIRWDAETRRSSLEDLTDAQIRHDFQLLSNQRNQQKREVCRQCYQTGRRGIPFGVKFFAQGDERWPEEVPRRGKDAEAGCVGCGWYDMDVWRRALNDELAKANQPE